MLAIVGSRQYSWRWCNHSPFSDPAFYAIVRVNGHLKGVRKNKMKWKKCAGWRLISINTLTHKKWWFKWPKFTRKRASHTLLPRSALYGVLTCDDVQISIFGFVVGMLRVLAALLLNDWLILNQLVLLAKANVTVGVKLSDVPSEILDMYSAPCFTSNNYRRFKIDIWWLIGLVRIVQVVIIGVETLSAWFKGTKKRFKSWTKHLSHYGNINTETRNLSNCFCSRVSRLALARSQ